MKIRKENVMGNAELKQAILSAKELLFENEEFKAKLKDVMNITGIKDFLHGFVPLWSILKSIVAATEIVYAEYHKCTEEQRIDVASELLDELITFKGWLAPLELFDGVLFKALISAAVQALNDKFGHNWLEGVADSKVLIAKV
jgi:hypothetical protein